MALHDVLSAMRVIILDLPSLPGSTSERERQFATMFPALTADELTDLARIDPDRWQTYTSSIFLGERSILKGHFPMTFAHLERIWPEVYGAPLRNVEFLRAVHERTPWRSAQTLELVQNFCDYVQSALPQLNTRAPFLKDLVEIEHASMRIRRAIDADAPSDLIGPQMLAPMTVDALLELEIAPRALHRRLHLAWDLFTYRVSFLENGRNLPDGDPIVGEAFAFGGRDSELTVRWVRVPKEIFELLSNTEDPIAVYELAEVVVGLHADEPEQQQLERTIHLAAQLAQIGMVRWSTPTAISAMM